MKLHRSRSLFAACLILAVAAVALSLAAAPLTYEGKSGPGKGKHIVFLAGDEEYRSEEGLPMLARIMAVRHGFTCTVLFSINPADGTIDPNNVQHVPGLEALDHADLCVMLWRFRELPDDQMKHFVDYFLAGKPIIGLRTSTHAFSYEKNKQSPFVKYDWRSKEWPGGFGQQVLGDTWISHHGNHGKESTRGIPNPAAKDHPILKGVQDVWGPTDVYGIVHLPADATVLMHGQVLEGMDPADKPVDGPKNNPMMPLVWVREYKNETGRTNRILTTTMGASMDLQSEDLRRLLVNGCYWALGLAGQIAARSDAAIVGDYKPTYFGFGKYTKGVKPSDHALK